MVSPEGGYDRGSLGDFFGFPCKTISGDGEGQTNQIDGTFEHSAYPARMYAKIMNHYYINENAEDEVAVSEDPGLDETTSMELFNVNWQKTLETGVLPDTMRGDPIFIPIGPSAPVLRTDEQTRITANYNPTGVNIGATLGVVANGGVNASGAGITDYDTKMYTDLSEADGVNYDEFQKAARVAYAQRLNMRAGYKLVEWTLANFGVKVPDDTIQEPVYLGGGTGNIWISPVEQTSETTENSPLGHVAGRGTGAVKCSHIRRTFTQHGWVMAIMSICPTPSYSQGLAKRFQRKTRWDYALPVMDGAGDDKLLNSQVYVSGSNVTNTDGTLVDDGEFGYIPRYEEYRTESNRVCGEMRKGGSMADYTATRFFEGGVPKFGKDFVKADPSYRGFAVTDPDVDHVKFSVLNNIRMLRPLSLYGDPGLI